MMLMIVLLPLMMPAVSRPSVSGEFGGKLRWMELGLEQLHFQEIPNTKTQIPINSKYQLITNTKYYYGWSSVLTSCISRKYQIPNPKYQLIPRKYYYGWSLVLTEFLSFQEMPNTKYWEGWKSVTEFPGNAADEPSAWQIRGAWFSSSWWGLLKLLWSLWFQPLWQRSVVKIINDFVSFKQTKIIIMILWISK